MKWTRQQLRAIIARGSDVLVTASAGTGKTAVLSGRCVNIVSEKKVCPDVLSVLVLTFTEAAAEQMRSRIAEQLTDVFLESGDPHLRQQLILLQGADISTIHSFCKRLITDHFHEIGLDPTFRVIDADEARLLKAEALEKTIDWAWQQSNLAQGLQQLFYRRDLRTTDGFLTRVITISEFLDGVVSRENWYERATLLSEAANPFVGTLGEKQKQIIADRLQHIHDQLQYAKKLYQDQDTVGDWADKCEDIFIKPVVQCVEFLEAGDWDRFSEEIRNFEKPAVRKPKGLSESVDELIVGMVKEAMAAFVSLSELAILNPDYLDKVGRVAGLQTKILIELVKKFDRLYTGAKQAINCLDFADLEHYALKLLTDENSLEEDEPLPSETALTLRRRYKYIFVDEYQDINSVQQAILDLLSAGGNVFVVGDVKQSIYAWRGAKPEVFLENLKSASVQESDASRGLRVDLNTNFRSAKGILDFVNEVFARIMTASFAKLGYDESAKLRPAPADKSKATTAGDAQPAVEFHILNERDGDASPQNHQAEGPTDSESSSAISSRQHQAMMIARRIRRMVGAENGRAEFEIFDKQQDRFRPVEYRDIVILMRSLAAKAGDYVELLRLAGVPVRCDAVAGYFEATEIRDMLCLLKVLDNPVRDIELAAVLRSPVFGISDTGLAKTKIHGKTDKSCKSFYDSVIQYDIAGPDKKLADRLKMAIEQVEYWRTLARRGNLADLIWQIYRQTGLLSFVSALPNGQVRRANLLKLHDRAIQFEGFASSAGIPSLTRFVAFIEKLQEVGQDWAPAEPDSSAENAVRIISVHKSKGLEFPVVFLAELNSRFNKRDIYGDCLADARYALGLQIIDRRSNTRLTSLAHQIIAEEKLSTALAEEMRILYVATTRARDRLILTAAEKMKQCRDVLCRGFFFGDKAIPDWQLRSSQSPLEWLLYGLCKQKNLHELFQTGFAAEAGNEELFSIELYGQSELRELSDYILRLKANKSRQTKPTKRASRQKEAVGRLLSKVKESLAWRYQLGDSSLVPAKCSVTQLTHRNDEYVRFDYSRALERVPRVLSAGQVDRSVPAEARLVGTATHLVIARLNLTKPVNENAIREIKRELLDDGAVTEAVAERVNAQAIMKFFESELGRTVLDEKNRIWREWPFTSAIPASEWIDTRLVPDTRYEVRDTIIIQGIIDVLVRTPAGLLVVDFKTDDIAADKVPERAELYREQLELYSRAASAILNSRIHGKWLCFLAPGQQIEV
ncbi:MAG: helicase-exonuclease AddAB subunit AddA [Planctomycetota bacterium]|jgi:ATP-dependent helicase/nuclease subunit A